VIFVLLLRKVKVNMQVFSLFDRKLREYGQLVLSNNAEGAKRGLVDGVVGSKSLIEKHPGDFDLMHVGGFDMDSGILVGLKVPTLVCNIGELLRPGDE